MNYYIGLLLLFPLVWFLIAYYGFYRMGNERDPKTIVLTPFIFTLATIGLLIILRRQNEINNNSNYFISTCIRVFSI